MPHSGRAPRRGDIQGLRAAAVAIVVAYHAGFGFSGGFVGVDVFFVISGYVITGVLLRELDAQDSVDLKRFYLRRLRRLLPALGVMLAVVLAAGSLLSPAGGQQMTARTGAAAALFNANNYLLRLEPGYFDPDLELNALLHTWSLSVEEQFYLGFPILILLTWRIGAKRSWLTPRQAVAVGLIATSTASLALTLYLVYFSGRGTSLAFYLAPARAWEFVVGALLALRPDVVAHTTRRFATPLAVSGSMALAWATFTYDEATVFPGIAVALPVVGTTLLLIAGEAAPYNPISRSLAWAPAQWLGDRSYGWYLWHWPALVFGAAMFGGSSTVVGFAVIVSLGFASASHHLVEQPIRFRPSVPAGATIRLAALCIGVPVIGALALSGVDRWFDNAGYTKDLVAHADQNLGCDSSVPISDRGTAGCVWPAEEPAGVAVLIGDSQAGQLIEGFTAAMADLNYTAIAASKSSCPFVDLRVERHEYEPSDDECRSFVAQSTLDLVELSPDIVVIASATNKYLSGAFRISMPEDESQVFRTSLERERAWGSGLERTVTTLMASDIDVVLAGPIPNFHDWDPRGCAVARWVNFDHSCAVTSPKAEQAAALAPGRRSESFTIDRTGARSMELFDRICPGEECSTLGDSAWTMRDATHISVPMSEKLAPAFRLMVEASVHDRPEDS